MRVTKFIARLRRRPASWSRPPLPEPPKLDSMIVETMRRYHEGVS